MIVVDTSAIIAILLNEPLGAACRECLITADEVALSAGTFVELRIAASSSELRRMTDALFEEISPQVVPVSREFAEQVGSNYRVWGKGFHNAKLNMGDVYAYTLAQQLSAPLLFIGKDFSQTDIKSVLENPDPERA